MKEIILILLLILGIEIAQHPEFVAQWRAKAFPQNCGAQR